MSKRIRLLAPVNRSINLNAGRDGSYSIEIHPVPTPSLRDPVPFLYFISAQGANGKPSVPLSDGRPTPEEAQRDWIFGFETPADIDPVAGRIVLALLATGFASEA